MNNVFPPGWFVVGPCCTGQPFSSHRVVTSFSTSQPGSVAASRKHGATGPTFLWVLT